MTDSRHVRDALARKHISGADAIKKFIPSLGIPYLGV